MKKCDFIGIACLDQVSELSYFPAEDQKIRALRSYSQSGGFATNASKIYALLGGKAFLHTALGKGIIGQEVKEDVLSYGVHIYDYLLKSDDFKTPHSTIILNKKNGSRTVVSSAKDNYLSYLPNIKKLDGDVLFVDGFFINTAIEAVKDAKQRNSLIVFDADKWRDDRYKEILPFVDYVIASEEFKPPQCETKDDVFQYLIDFDLDNIAITNGKDDVLVYHDKNYSSITIEKTNVVDSLGAGDVLHGAFCYYIKDNDFVPSLRKASKVATKFCEGYGFSSLL